MGDHAETVTRKLAVVLQTLDPDAYAVVVSALRSVEEELARVRVLVHDHIDANGRLRKEGNALREERDGARLAGQEVVAALVERTAQRNKAEADRDRLANTLLIAHEFIESVGSWVGCHPDERAEVLAEVDAALAALPPVQGEHEQDGDRCIVCGGKGRRSSWVNELGREVEGECRDCDGTGKAQDGEEIRRRAIHIIYSGEYDDLTGEQAKALAESDTPLIGYAQDGDTEETT